MGPLYKSKLQPQCGIGLGYTWLIMGHVGFGVPLSTENGVHNLKGGYMALEMVCNNVHMQDGL